MGIWGDKKSRHNPVALSLYEVSTWSLSMSTTDWLVLIQYLVSLHMKIAQSRLGIRHFPDFWHRALLGATCIFISSFQVQSRNIKMLVKSVYLLFGCFNASPPPPALEPSIAYLFPEQRMLAFVFLLFGGLSASPPPPALVEEEPPMACLNSGACYQVLAFVLRLTSSFPFGPKDT